MIINIRNKKSFWISHKKYFSIKKTWNILNTHKSYIIYNYIIYKFVFLNLSFYILFLTLYVCIMLMFVLYSLRVFQCVSIHHFRDVSIVYAFFLFLLSLSLSSLCLFPPQLRSRTEIFTRERLRKQRESRTITATVRWLLWDLWRTLSVEILTVVWRNICF